MASKYGFEEMCAGDKLVFRIGKKAEAMKIKSAAKAFFRSRNWQLSTSVQKHTFSVIRGDGCYGISKIKGYLGRIPESSEGWRQVGQCFDEDIEWMVFCKSQDHTPEWKTFKVVANGRALTKANYWLAMNVANGKVGFARDYALMREHRPSLHTKIERIFKRLADEYKYQI